MGLSADERRKRQAASIGFVPAPAGQSRLAMEDDREGSLEDVMRRTLPEGKPLVHAYLTRWGISVLDLR